jgi:hypothetical protein
VVTRNRLPLALVPEVPSRGSGRRSRRSARRRDLRGGVDGEGGRGAVEGDRGRTSEIRAVIVTLDPTGPLVGVKELSVGAAVGTVTVKLVALFAVPPGVVTLPSPHRPTVFDLVFDAREPYEVEAEA